MVIWWRPTTAVRGAEPLEVGIRYRKPRPLCESCGGSGWSKGHRTVVLVDVPGVWSADAAAVGGGNGASTLLRVRIREVLPKTFIGDHHNSIGLCEPRRTIGGGDPFP